MYGAVIIMNLLVALMTNALDEYKAEVMINTQRVEDLSDKLMLPFLGLFNICKVGITSFSFTTQTPKDPELVNKKDINLEDFHEEPVENPPSQAVSVRKYSFQLFSFFKIGFFPDGI